MICVMQVDEGGVNSMQRLSVLQWERILAGDSR